jgi:NADPH:quinone reductase-like Zn-dependent oxidoreductase
MDVAGVLERVGEGVSPDLEVGERVMAIVVPRGARGGYVERAVVRADSATRAPAGVSLAEAATLPMNGLTARLALDELGLDPGQWLAVTGAAGAVGGYALQLAKVEGLRVVADAASTDRELIKGLGADHVVERGAGFADRVRSVVPEGVGGVVDAALLNDLVAPAVRDGGGIATLRGFTGPPDRGVTWHPVYVRNYALAREKLDELRQLVEAGSLTLRVAKTLPSEAAPEAHRLLEAGGVRGRLVLEF